MEAFTFKVYEPTVRSDTLHRHAPTSMLFWRGMRVLLTIAVCVLLGAGPAISQLGDWMEKVGLGESAQVDESETVAGLKEALLIGAENAVLETGRLDGYFQNEVIKILLPEDFELVERGLRLGGQGDLVDEFVLSMNRAAEKAAPQAKEIFWSAIQRLDFEDALQILRGGDTAATDYFRAATSDQLASAFLPVVQRATEEVGATRKYKELIGRYRSIPFAQAIAFDVDAWVVEKGLDGLFYVLAEEERRIRTDPVARVTELLQKVFAG